MKAGRRGLGVSIRRPDALGLLPQNQTERGRHDVRRARAHGRRGARSSGSFRLRNRLRARVRALLPDSRARGRVVLRLPRRVEVPIHNASLLVASLFARRGRAEDALPALRYSLQRQRPDGSWPTGSAPLSAGWTPTHRLRPLEPAVGLERRGGSGSLRRGARPDPGLLLTRFVDPDGAVRASPESRYPVTSTRARRLSGRLRLARTGQERAPDGRARARLDPRDMRRDDGRFAFQRRRLMRASVPYARWSDGHMLLALAEYVSAS